MHSVMNGDSVITLREIIYRSDGSEIYTKVFSTPSVTPLMSESSELVKEDRRHFDLRWSIMSSSTQSLETTRMHTDSHTVCKPYLRQSATNVLKH